MVAGLVSEIEEAIASVVAADVTGAARPDGTAATSVDTTDLAGRTIRPYRSPADTALNQFLVVLKPELTAPAGADAGRPVARVLDVLTGHGVEVGAVRVLSTGYLARHGVMRQHYRALWDVSHRGAGALPPAVRDRLAARYPDAAADGQRVVGGHELLARRPDLSTFALELVTRNVPVVKLGAGVYAIELLLDDTRLVVLNPFHPHQVAHFTTPGRAVVVLECRSRRHLHTIRSRVIGATDPAEAVAGSAKAVLYREQHRLGIAPVCTRRNAVHVSPGPVEAMFAIQRYFSTPDDELPIPLTAFAAELAAAGIPAGRVATLADDPEVELRGRRGPLFEITEDMNWDEAVVAVAAVLTAGAR